MKYINKANAFTSAYNPPLLLTLLSAFIPLVYAFASVDEIRENVGAVNVANLVYHFAFLVAPTGTFFLRARWVKKFSREGYVLVGNAKAFSAERVYLLGLLLVLVPGCIAGFWGSELSDNSVIVRLVFTLMYSTSLVKAWCGDWRELKMVHEETATEISWPEFSFRGRIDALIKGTAFILFAIGGLMVFVIVISLVAPEWVSSISE